MELLKQLYCIHSKSRKEDKMLEFLVNWLFDNQTSAYVEMDKTGNIYVTKGVSDTYPCIVAHVDQVQTLHSDDFKVVETESILLGYSLKNRRFEGLGADDKNGVWVALKCLLKYEVLKVALFVGEEIGCVGSSAADMTFFENCRFVIQCDRRGYGDFITEASLTELCSKDFAQATDFKLFGYSETSGMMTDVMTLKENGLNVSCVNLSCGYYEPHTDKEFTIKSDLLNCLSLVEHIIENVTGVYPHEYVYKPYSGGYGYGGYGYTSKNRGYYDENGVWHSTSYSYGSINNKPNDGVCNSKATTTKTSTTTSKVAETPKENSIQKFWDDEEQKGKKDWIDEFLEENKERELEFTEELHDELYDVIYELLCCCPSASYDMIRSSVLHTYPDLNEKDINSVYGEVKYDMRKYMSMPCE